MAVRLRLPVGLDEKGKQVTQKQAELLKFIKKYWEKRGYGPSFAEMLEATGHKSKGGLHRRLQSLCIQGFLVRTGLGSSRNYMPSILAQQYGITAAQNHAKGA